MKHPSLFPVVLTVFLDMLGFGIVIPVLGPLFVDPASPLFSPEVPYATRTLLLGVVMGLYPLAQFFGAPILGALSDRFGRKWPLLISIAVNTLGYAMFAFGVGSGQFWLLAVSRVVAGLAGGNIAIAYSAIADVSDARTKVHNFGLVGMAFAVGFVLGPFFGGSLADPSLVSWFTIATPFWFAGLLGLVNLMAVLAFFRETLRERVHNPASLLTGVRNVRKAFTQPSLRSMFVVVFLLTFGFTCFTNFFQVFLIDRFQATPLQIGQVFAYVGLWIAFTQGALARLVSARASPSAVLRACSPLLAVALAGLIIPPTFGWLFLILPVISVSEGLIVPNLTAMVSALVGARSQGEIMGISQSVQALAMALPPAVAGVLSGFDPRAPLIAAAVVTLFGWGMLLRRSDAPIRDASHEG
ncbi:MFS transporter [Patescibacteria group bacterium]|nr:MAG: MFS transporter [Patescibacteria group bacterium]